jgi:hypothetical protein
MSAMRRTQEATVTLPATVSLSFDLDQRAHRPGLEEITGIRAD